MLEFQRIAFPQLTPAQLYEILELRSRVFVEEQACTLPDVDGKDPNALHLVGREAGQLVAYMRIFLPNSTDSRIVFGRVATLPNARRKGYGRALMGVFLTQCDREFPGIPIKCSAQLYLQKFYESFGFEAYGEPYDEAGIRHIAMKRVPAK